MTNTTYNNETKELVLHFKPSADLREMFKTVDIAEVTSTLWKVPATGKAHSVALEVAKVFGKQEVERFYRELPCGTPL